MHKTTLIPAYVLHARPYRETSLLVEIFTAEHGRVSLIAKGVRGKSAERGRLLQPFLPLLLSFQGRSQQKLLTHVEAAYVPIRLSGSALACGFYLNELVMRLLLHHDEHQVLYQAYETALNQLREENILGNALRHFEFCLLKELGYGILLTHDIDHQVIQSQVWYRFEPEKGFIALAQPLPSQKPFCFFGAHLQAIAASEYDHAAVRADAKRLMQMALAPHLGEKPLASRALLV